MSQGHEGEKKRKKKKSKWRKTGRGDQHAEFQRYPMKSIMYDLGQIASLGAVRWRWVY